MYFFIFVWTYSDCPCPWLILFLFAFLFLLLLFIRLFRSFTAFLPFSQTSFRLLLLDYPQLIIISAAVFLLDTTFHSFLLGFFALMGILVSGWLSCALLFLAILSSTMYSAREATRSIDAVCVLGCPPQKPPQSQATKISYHHLTS